MRSVVNCQAKSKLRVAGTLAAVPFRIIDWDFRARAPARNRARTNRSITSTSTISLSTRTTEPTHRGIGCRTVLRCRDDILAPVAEEEGTTEHTEHTEIRPTRICAPFPCFPRIPWLKNGITFQAHDRLFDGGLPSF